MARSSEHRRGGNQVEIDTGANHSIIPWKFIKDLPVVNNMVNTKKKFASYTKHPLKAIGKLYMEITHKAKKESVKFL